MSLQFVHSHDAQHQHGSAIWALATTPTDHVLSASLDGSLVLHASSQDATLPLNNPESVPPGVKVRSWPAQPLAWVSLSVASTGHKALVNSIIGTTMLVDYASGDVIGKKTVAEKAQGVNASTYSEPAWSVSLSSDGRTYASTGGGGTVTIHAAKPSESAVKGSMDYSSDTPFGSALSVLQSGRSKYGLFVDHNPSDDTKIAMSSESGQVYVFDAEKGTAISTWASHALPVRSLGWSGDGNLLMSASDDRRLVLHDTRTASESSSSAVAHLTGHSLPVLSVALSPADGRLALSGSRDGTVRIWDIGMRKAVGTVREGKEVWGVAWRSVTSRGAGAAAGVKMEGVEGFGHTDEAIGGGFGGIGGSGASGFVTGGEEGVVRWYRGAGLT